MTTRTAELFSRRLVSATVFTAVLLALAMTSVAVGMSNVIRNLDPFTLILLAFIAIGVAWWCASANISRTMAAGIIVIAGIGLVLGYLGALNRFIVPLVIQLGSVPWRWGIPLDIPPALTDLMAGVVTLVQRLGTWFLALARGEPGYDPVASALVWNMAMWGVSAWAGWSVRKRRQPLHALVPAGILLSVTSYYSGATTIYLLLLFGALLLLLPLVGHAERERRWRAEHVGFSLEIRVDIAAVVLPLVLGIMMVSSVVPSISIRQIVRSAQRIFAGPAQLVDPVAGSLGVQRRSPDSSVFEPVRAPGLPQKQLIGAGPELSEQIALQVEIDTAPATFRPYWRSFTYDQYTGRGWRTSDLGTERVAAGDPLIANVPPAHEAVRQIVERLNSSDESVYAAGTLVSLDRPAIVARRSGDDVFGVRANVQRYEATALVPTVGVAALRGAGATPGYSDYPEYVRRHYLQLPDDIPVRVLSLARDLTATEPTPYDRARAIELYLRGFDYTLDLPAPPVNRDIADYFLFDLRRGYCDYYATSMVVLARAAGLPARLAVGYIGGSYDADAGVYTVSEAEAHSWPEIYFPDYGWITFEPTAGRPAFERREETEVSPEETAFELPASRIWWRLPVQALGIGLTLLTTAGIVWLLIDAWRLRRQPPATAVASIYGRLYGQGRRLTRSPLGDTPYEFAHHVSEQMHHLAKNSRWRGILQPAPDEVNTLTSLYVRTEYSPHQPTTEDKVRALRAWRRLQGRLWLAWLQERIRRDDNL